MFKMGIIGTYIGDIPEVYYIYTGGAWSIKGPSMTLTWADTSGGKYHIAHMLLITVALRIDRHYNYRGNNYTAGGCAKINTAFNLTPYKYLKFERVLERLL